MSENIIMVEELRKYFPLKESFLFGSQKWIRAIDGVSFEVKHGETFGLVGESGCGKSTLARTILRLIEPTSGKVYFKGKDIYALKKMELKEFRRKVQIVFQDPFASLDPRMVIEDIISEPLSAHNLFDKEEKRKVVIDILEKVGLKTEDLRKYPHEFSGGQRQRIAIARALVLKPELVVLDEPTSSLDVSVQSQILNLLMDLKRDFDLTCLFISHNLGVISHICERLGIMYLGKIVEIGPAEKIFESPYHPYTQFLISAIPSVFPKKYVKKVLMWFSDELPSPLNPPSGCRFHPRCPYTMRVCKEKEPQLEEIDKKHVSACYLYS
ncbi:MAG: dipeptide ABC transporter ATP-binding protein [Candidatus Jordarchaeaceae archaeon]